MTEALEDHPAIQSIRRDGFLSAAIVGVIPILRGLHQAWFDLAEQANRLGQRRMNAVEAACFDRSTQDPISLAARLLIRTQSGLQAVLILAERGMTLEAEALVRGLYENSFWLAYLQANPSEAVQAIRWDELRSQIGRSKALVAQVDLGDDPDAALRGKLLAQIANAEREVRGKPRLGVEALANKGEFGDLYMFYKMLSSSSAHPSLHSLSKHLLMDTEGSAIGHVVGPDQEGTARALTLAVHAHLSCLAAFNATWPEGDGVGEVAALFTAHTALSKAARGAAEAP